MSFPRPPPLQRQLVASRRPSLRREQALLGELANTKIDLAQARERIDRLKEEREELRTVIASLRCGPHG